MKDLNEALAENEADATEAFLKSLPELTAGETFRFACHPEVPCFNACCSDLTLMLTPYDALRLRRALGVTPVDFMNHFARRFEAPDTPLSRPRAARSTATVPGPAAPIPWAGPPSSTTTAASSNSSSSSRSRTAGVSRSRATGAQPSG